MATTDDREVSFPTLGRLLINWIAAHCVIPDGFDKGHPFVLSGWQQWVTVNEYRVSRLARVGQLAPAFYYRRTQVIHCQKSGKGPWSAADAIAQADGPVIFDGWAEPGEVFDCRSHGCGCGFVLPYKPGEPKGRRWPTPLVQITAFSEDQTDNIWRPLQSMIRYGPLADRIKVGEEFARLPNDGRIDVVTSSARSRLGNPITAAYQDETGLWTKQNGMLAVADTQRRGLAGMGGRAIETTNAYDPAEQSVAQLTAESRSVDVFRFCPQAPTRLSFRNKRERRQILRQLYAESPWVDVDAIEAEAAELLERDPAQAERFFGNRIVATSDAYFDTEAWHACASPADVPAGATITLGFDGSMVDDWTAIRARWVTEDGTYGFTPTFADGVPTIWNPADYSGEVPRGEVQAAVEHLFDTFDVQRFYCDPELWQSEIEGWATRWGDKRVVTWATYRTRQMAAALERLRTDVATHSLTHDDCAITAAHVANARRVRRSGGVVIGKPNEHQKIDAVMADALAHEAACDVLVAGIPKKRTRRMVVYR